MKLIDISHTLNNETPVYPGDYKTSISQSTSLEKDYYNSYLLKTGMHTGTHIDVPMHLTDDKRTVSEFLVDRFVGNGVLLDVRGEDIITMKTEYENIIFEESIVLLYTGFDKYYFEEKYFDSHPVVSDELCGFLVSKNIKMLGFDMPSPDYPPFKCHKTLFKKDICMLENLTNLHSLIGVDTFEVIALPIKISAEASLVRAVCRID